MAKNRYIGEYPVIGIRPIVDGRRGPMQLREGLEDQVMAMAQAAKKLYEENLYYSNGEPVKVVIADTSIGRVPESAACAEKFKPRGRCHHAVRHALLVLRLRDHGHGSHDHQGRLGLQRHGASGRCVSGVRSGDPRAEGPARLRHLRP